MGIGDEICLVVGIGQVVGIRNVWGNRPSYESYKYKIVM